MTSASPVHLVDERRFDPPRRVRLCDDGRGWMADVEWSELYEWGLGKHLSVIPPQRVRPSDG